MNKGKKKKRVEKVLGLFFFFIKTSNQTLATNNRMLSKIGSAVAEISIIGSAANLSAFSPTNSRALSLISKTLHDRSTYFRYFSKLISNCKKSSLVTLLE